MLKKLIIKLLFVWIFIAGMFSVVYLSDLNSSNIPDLFRIAVPVYASGPLLVFLLFIEKLKSKLHS